MKRTEQINTIYIGYDPKEDAAYEVLRDTIKAVSYTHLTLPTKRIV